MAILDDLKTAVTSAISAGTSAARGQGTAIKGDFENLVKPNLDAVAVQIAAITEDVITGNISQDQAKEDLGTQLDNIQPLILAEAELALLAVQVIIDAVINALKSVVNTVTKGAIGVALL